MKKLMIMAAVVCGLALQALAAEGDWMTDYPKAVAKAKAEKKMLLMDFTGSDWCPPCKQLNKNVFSSAEFLDYAKKNLVLVEVDFPRNKKQSEELKKANDELQKKFEIEGYPTVIVMDSEGKELSKKVGYDGATAKDYIAKLDALKKK